MGGFSGVGGGGNPFGSAIDLSEMATIANDRLVGNVSGGAAIPAELTAAEGRTLLGLVIGTNVQAYDADLTTYAGITPSANIQTLLGAADYAAMRTQLGLVIGTNVQAYDADLGVIAALADPNADRILFWDDSAGQYAYLSQGTGIWITGTTLALKVRIAWTATAGIPPTSNPATPDVRNERPVLDFDDTTSEGTYFEGYIPLWYSGGDFTVEVEWATTTATSGTGGWLVTIERIAEGSLDVDSSSFATAKTITAVTVPGTSGLTEKTSVTLTAGATDTDSVAAGDRFRLRIQRDTAVDTASGDLELFGVILSEV